MYDLNDYYYYAAVVTHGGFGAAARALSTPRSKFSRRVARLEAELDARLIERSTRTFRVTAIGQEFYERCKRLLDEAETARNLVSDTQGAPRGTIRLGCPLALVDVLVATFLSEFLNRYPDINVEIFGQDTKSDIIADGIDVEIRTGMDSETQTTLTMRKLGRARTILVAGGTLAERASKIASPRDLATFPLVSMSRSGQRYAWKLHCEQTDESEVVEIQPRLVCRSLTATLGAVRDGLGIGLLLNTSCQAEIESGRLQRVLPEWQGLESQFYLVFTTKRGLPARVRALVDFFVERSKSG